MNTTINSEMIVLARESRGFSQSYLAGLLECKQAYVSKLERGLQAPSEETIRKLSEVLKYPKTFFYNRTYIYPGISFHRKKVALGQKEKDLIHARINVIRMNIDKLLQSVELEHEDMPHYSIDEYGTPEKIAQVLRRKWLIPKGPVRDLTGLIESNGGIVIKCNFGTSHVDGISLLCPQLPPLIFLNSTMPGDRERFTLAHELGHVIMHQIPSETMEDEANRFAAEFLMPEEDVRGDLGYLTMRKLVELKQYWKVSMQALLYRANRLKLMEERRYYYFMMEMSKLGYRTNEPGQIQSEEPTTVKSMINLYRDVLGSSYQDIATLLDLHEEEFEQIYSIPSKKLRLVVKEQNLQEMNN